MPVRYADPERGCIADLVDLARYPLPLLGQRASDEYQDLVATLRARLDCDGLVQLRGFVRADALAAARREMRALGKTAEVRDDWVSVYSRDTLLSHRDDDPRTRLQQRRSAHVTRDMLGPHTVAHRMYASPVLKRLVADCVGLSRVYEFADPLAGLIATVLAPGGVIPWHYDSNDFVVTLVIDRADNGGRFEYVPNLRRPGNENLAGLSDILDSTDHPSIRRPSNGAGDLQIFRGRHSLHRVSPVSSGGTRIAVVFGYAGQPGVIGPVDRTRTVYGRVTETHLLAEQNLHDQDVRDGLIR